jgi:predicted alpha/beta superfamily hydrolase
MLETFQLFIPTTQDLRTIRVYKPAICDEISCDVLFMHDAQNIFDDALSYHDVSWRVMDALKDSAYQHLIVVGIDNHPKERMNEYSPYMTTLEFKDRFIKGTGGKGFIYIDWMKDVLIPRIKQTYNTSERYYMAGSSMGAYISMFAVMRYPHLFKAIGCFSIASWFNETQFLKDLKQADIQKETLFWISVGAHESSSKDVPNFHEIYINNSKHVYAYLKEKDIVNIMFTLHPGEHNERQWMELFPEFINFIQTKK